MQRFFSSHWPSHWRRACFSESSRAWHASQTNINEQIKDGTRATGGLQHARARSILMIAEIALAMVLLVGAGLLIQSFVRMRQAALGFDPKNLLTVAFRCRSADTLTIRRARG